MKNKLTVVLSMALVISVMCTTMVYANTNRFSNMPGAEQSFGSEPVNHWVIRDKVEETRKFTYNMYTESNQYSFQSITVSYDRTMNTTLNDYVDVYVDDMGNEYVYDTDGSVIGVFMTKNTNIGLYSSSENNAINKNTSQTNDEVAYQFLRSIYGDWFDKYQLVSVDLNGKKKTLK